METDADEFPTRSNFQLDYMMAIQGSLATKVEQSYFGDSRRWPVLSGFRGDIYQWLPNWRLYVLVDDQRVSTPPISGTVSPPRLNVDASVPTAATVADLHFEVRQLLGLRPQDVVFVLPNMPVSVPSLDELWEQWSVEERDLWERQLLLNIESHWYLLKGFDVNNGFLLPPGYQYLGDSCRRLLEEHPDFDRNVFLMTRFGDDKYLHELDEVLRATLRERGLNPLRADDKVYPANRNLWDNVCTYMLCCGKGVAILEDRGVHEFNPNVAIEYGFMRALNRPTLLLADAGFRNLRADIIGTLREQFDLLDMPTTVPPAIGRWLADISHGRGSPRSSQ